MKINLVIKLALIAFICLINFSFCEMEPNQEEEDDDFEIIIEPVEPVEVSGGFTSIMNEETFLEQWSLPNSIFSMVETVKKAFRGREFVDEEEYVDLLIHFLAGFSQEREERKDENIMGNKEDSLRPKLEEIFKDKNSFSVEDFIEDILKGRIKQKLNDNDSARNIEEVATENIDL